MPMVITGFLQVVIQIVLYSGASGLQVVIQIVLYSGRSQWSASSHPYSDVLISSHPCSVVLSISHPNNGQQ